MHNYTYWSSLVWRMDYLKQFTGPLQEMPHQRQANLNKRLHLKN